VSRPAEAPSFAGMAGLDPFGLLVEELKSDEIQDQVI
jgi:hypothetical protein